MPMNKFMNARYLLAVLLVGMVGCVQEHPKHVDFHPQPQAPVKQASPVKAGMVGSSQARTEIIGHSTQGREITMTMFGTGARPVLVMGGIHGSEPTSVDVAQGVLAALKTNPARAGTTAVAVIPVANPDGYLIRSRYNARGVDLNRNFPANNWRKAPATGRRNYGGNPLSEPESQAIASVIDTLQPRLIISIHSIDDGKHCNNYDGPAEPIAKVMSQYNGYQVTATMGYPTPGSLGSYAGIDKQIPIITLELPRSVAGPKAWEQNEAAIFAAITAAQ
jgi:murein peptide amidase A